MLAGVAPPATATAASGPEGTLTAWLISRAVAVSEVLVLSGREVALPATALQALAVRLATSPDPSSWQQRWHTSAISPLPKATVPVPILQLLGQVQVERAIYRQVLPSQTLDSL